MAESWASNSNTATVLKLVGAPGPSSGAFHPDFTYPIFGEAETIYGYQGLAINLHFASGCLRPLLRIDYGAKNESTTAKIDDVEATLKEFLPDDYLSGDQLAAFDEVVKGDVATFRPFGEKVGSYTRRRGGDKGKGKARSGGGGAAGDSNLSEDDPNARVFEIYRSTWDTEGFRDYHRRMQIFALFFIEGASYIQEEETNWEFFCLYEKVRAADPQAALSWHFVGYTSLYRFWCWPDAARVRLSQFVILPPYQKNGHGGALYSAVHGKMLDRDEVSEMTVEDPSEAFDRLRDGSDLRRLLAPGGFVECAKKEGKLKAPIDRAWSEVQRRQLKIAPRQWSRLVEMIQLLNLDPEDGDQVRAYRLQVKARLFRFNKDILTQLPKHERLVKLQETYESVIDEYGELVGVDIEPILAVGEAQDGSGRGGEAEGPPRKMARFV
ncbi:histone acetyltransferase 1 [Thecaphora frezii]